MGLRALDCRPQMNASYGGQVSLTSVEGWSGILGSARLTEDSSLTISTNYACRRNISEDTAKIPFKMLEYGKNAAGLETRTSLDEDSIAHIFNTQFNPNMTAFVGKSLMKDWQCGIGNAWAEKVRDQMGVLRELYPIHPSRVSWRRIPNRNKDGQLKYIFTVMNNNGTAMEFEESELYHTFGYSLDGRFGIPTIQLLCSTLGITSAMEAFMNAFYANAARPSCVITSTELLGTEARAQLRKEWRESYQGTANSGNVVVTDIGLDVKPFDTDFKAMEMTDLAKMTQNQIAMFYRMPMDKLQVVERAQGWSTLAGMEAYYIGDCLVPWLVREEQEIRRQLMGPHGAFEGYAPNVQPRFETKGLLRGDINTRKDYLQFRFNTASITPAGIMEIEDENPRDEPALNEFYIQSGFVPLRLAGAAVEAQVEAAKNPPASSSKPAATTEELDAFAKASRLPKLNGVHN